MTSIRSRTLHFLGAFGGYSIAKKITCSNARILMYHRFGKQGEYRKTDFKVFEKQLSYLVNNYEVTSLSDCISTLRRDVRKPKPMVVITVDDGYDDFYSYAYPILKKYNVPATVFLVTDFVEKKIWLWPDIIEYIIDKTDRDNIDYQSNECVFRIALNSPAARRFAWSEICDYCLTIANSRKLDLIDELKALLRVEVPQIPPKEYAALTWNDIHHIMKSNIEFGSHTTTHPILTKIPLENLEKEITESKRILEHKLQKEIRSFCYPQGRAEDYNEIIKTRVKQAGYQCAVTCNDGLNHPTQDLYELNRISDSSEFFLRNVSGASYVLNKLRNSLKGA